MVEPYYEDSAVTLYHGDCREILAGMPDESVHCVVTSPPYWGLRDYGIEPAVWDGEPGCEHEWVSIIKPASSGGRHGSNLEGGKATQYGSATHEQQKSSFCRHCNAWLGCLGLEPTPQLYLKHLVGIFEHVRRVLRKDGTCFVNIGDSYAGSWGAQSRPNGNDLKSTLQGGSMLSARQIQAHPRGQTHTGSLKNTPGLKPKDLCLIPFRLAIALQEAGWWVRSDIIWSKPNPMPESVTDRPTRSHEYVFLLSKSERYFWDGESVAEPSNGFNGSSFTSAYDQETKPGLGQGKRVEKATRNIRSVWTVPTQPSGTGIHFATFPTKLVERCIKAGCPEGGTVLDHFCGSGTTLYVAKELGRKGIGIDAKAEYLNLAARRLLQEVLPLRY